MTETPMDGKPRRNRNRPNPRDWFAPPPSQPSDITYNGPLPQPMAIPVPGTLRAPRDMRVWPPETEEPEEKDRSTQPFPAIRGTLAAPMPPPPTPPAPPAPATPPAPSASPSAPERKATPRRAALLGAGALLSVVLAVGAPGWFAYNVYKYGRPSDHIHTVQPGQAGTWQHVSWQVNLDRIPDPSGKPDTADRQWVKVTATRTALDGEGAIRHGAPEVTLADRSGRTWLTETLNDDTPPETADNKIGTPYRIELMGVVPPDVADQVAVLLRPSTYRSVPGQSVDDMFKEAANSTEKMDQVLQFLR